MKYIKNLELFLESNKVNTNLISDLCISMLLINPDFLNDILDKGNYTRYVYNNSVFLSDLKQLLINKNRLKLGMKKDERYVEDDNIGKVNSYFNEHSKEFDIEKDFNKLIKARDIARNIYDKMDDIRPEMVKNVYWLSPNKETGMKEDIVLELVGGKQYPIVLNSKISTSKSKSFNTILDIILDEGVDQLFSEKYIDRWDKLTKEWFKLIYNNSRTEYKIFIDNFIDASRADSLTYFNYIDIEIKDEKYKILGKHFSQLGKNYKELPKLMSDIWKSGNKGLQNFDELKEKWYNIKKTILNNSIIEHLLVNSLKNFIEDIEEKENVIIANNKIKNRFLKLFIDILNVEDTTVYYASKTEFDVLPSKQWFRDNYEDLKIEFDYHQKLTEESDYQILVKLFHNDDKLIDMKISTTFTGGEMSGRLSGKVKLDISNKFNSVV